ncbi:MAG: SGNH/GDSL hydrolase family protein [Candidatus Lernaella stagnicola]|nr:SGNH/GDSL hydrolase family protein [Candidatus Lernaella stagnicola]
MVTALFRFALKHLPRLTRALRHHWLLVLCLLLFSMEFTLRVYHVPYRITWIPEFPAYDRMLFYRFVYSVQDRVEYAPGTYCTMKSHGSFFIRGNGDDSPPPAPTADPVVVCLGGSTTWGGSVNDEETFPASLEQLLRRKRKDARVYNLGVPGSSTFYGLARGIPDALDLDPDTVVIAYGGLNDSFKVHFRESTYRPTSRLLMLLRSFHLYRVGEAAAFRYVLFPRPVMRVTREEYGANLESMTRRLRERGVAVVFVTEAIVPERMNRHDFIEQSFIDSLSGEMIKRSRQLNVPVVVAQRCLGSQFATLYQKNGIHWTAQGNAKIAACLADELAQSRQNQSSSGQ